MESIRGKTSLEMTATELGQRLTGYRHTLLDVGTGDGRYVRCMAEEDQETFFIGMDACRENLRANSLQKRPNTLFVIANAQGLPEELDTYASHITINFPWGSLLEGLLSCEDRLTTRLLSVAKPSADLEIHLNGEALAMSGWTLEAGADQIQRLSSDAGWRIKSQSWMDAQRLRSFPTTWAKRLAFGRDPRAIQLRFQRG